MVDLCCEIVSECGVLLHLPDAAAGLCQKCQKAKDQESGDDVPKGQCTGSAIFDGDGGERIGHHGLFLSVSTLVLQ